MSREITKPVTVNDGDLTIKSAPIASSDYIKANYAVITDEPNLCQLKCVGAKSDPTLEEVVTIKKFDLDKVSSTAKGMYPPSTVKGYKVKITDNYIARSTWSDGHITDDPVKLSIEFETTNGSGIVDGKEMLHDILRAVSFAMNVPTDGIVTTTTAQSRIDRMIRGAVKPAELV